MAKRRDKIRLSPEELETFIEEQKSLQVATINRDGTPHLSTLWFAVVDGDIVFETYTKSQKIKNLERDDRIALLLEDGLEYDKLRGAQINGRAELHTDPEVVHRYALEVMARNNPGVDREMLSKAAESMAQKRTAVVVKADTTITWDHTKLGGSY
ncbi:pyridoxamine 5'-phosphate oxidase family protein [Candidatus Poriferisocius sp.]|uniref:pyridoxamine 5'-phosphate oxidase family protein n=1 Tax=Candidatus Poriferisocius sp. TaxID=3101276 RepID=UPI003B5AD428